MATKTTPPTDYCNQNRTFVDADKETSKPYSKTNPKQSPLENEKTPVFLSFKGQHSKKKQTYVKLHQSLIKKNFWQHLFTFSLK